jgi:collagen type III alpha
LDPGLGRFIEQQVRRTRRRVKLVDLTGALLTLVAGSLIYLLAMMLVDHWLVPHGLGFRSRLAVWLVFVAGALLYAWHSLAPLLLRRINPLFAAQAIEQSRPTLKNSLINFLMLRGRSADLPPVVYEAIQQRAAADLSSVSLESAVDRSRLVKLGYVMLAILAFVCLYKVLSPKDPLPSLGRVIDPWSTLAVPTRVQIEDIRPGDCELPRDELLKVSAHVSGLDEDEPVSISYSTVDGQVVNHELRMSASDTSYRHEATLPDTSAGMQQDLTYTITAGDAVAGPFRAVVTTAPAIVVERVDYKYPAYTEIDPRVALRQGDIQALEGTEVTIHARATHDIRNATIHFDRKDDAILAMSANGREATVTFDLAFDAEGKPNHNSYHLEFTTPAGNKNQKLIEHKIEVVRDAGPDIAWLEPSPEPQREIPLPMGASLHLVFEASDPDFKLAKVLLVAEVDGKPLMTESLLPEPRPKFQGKYLFDSKKYKLRAGDLVTCWGVAEDNKQPRVPGAKNFQPNRAESSKLLIRIGSPQQKPQDQLAQARPPDEQPPKNDQPEPRDRKPPPGEKGERPQEQPPEKEQPKPQDGAPPKPSDAPRVDPDADPGKAIDEINKHFDDKKSAQQPQNQPAQQQPGDGEPEEQPGNQGSGEKQSGQQKPGEQKPGQQQPGKEKQSGDSQGQAHDHGEQPMGDEGAQQPKPKSDQSKESGEGHGQKTGQQRPSDSNQGGQAGDQQSGGEQGGKQPGQADKQPGGQGSQGGEPGQQQSGQKKSGQQPSGQQQDGQQQGGSSEKQPGQQGSGGEKQGDGQTQGQGKPEGGQRGESQPTGSKPDQSAGREAPREGGDKPAGGKPGDEQQPGAQQKMTGQDKSAQEKMGQGQEKSGGQEKSAQQKSGGAQGGEEKQGSPQGQPDQKSGQGAQGKQATEKPEGQEAAGGGKQKPDAQGGDREQGKGSSGAGQSEGDHKGSATPQNAGMPRDKQPDNQPMPEEKNESGEGNSPSRSEKESDSKGQTSGDQSGGGKEGGGQRANQPGTGGAGKNTAADEGGSQTNEKGPGETSKEGGDKSRANQPTDNAASQGKGPGSKRQPGDRKPGGDETANDPGKKPGQPGDNRGQANGPAGQMGAGNPTAGGPSNNNNTPIERQPGQAAPGEDPNLDYARKATDLAIDRLKDQLQKPRADQELLDKLKWSPEDAKRFVERWEEMKRNARDTGPKGDEAKRQLDETLRNLGLRPHGTTIAGDQAKADRTRNLRDALRTRPPPEYADQYRAYSTGTSDARAGENEK